MIYEEDPAVVEEVSAAVEEEGDAEGVRGESPPVDEYRISTRPRIVSGSS